MKSKSDSWYLIQLFSSSFGKSITNTNEWKSTFLGAQRFFFRLDVISVERFKTKQKKRARKSLKLSRKLISISYTCLQQKNFRNHNFWNPQQIRTKSHFISAILSLQPPKENLITRAINTRRFIIHLKSTVKLHDLSFPLSGATLFPLHFS